jgi:hypothetical protein
MSGTEVESWGELAERQRHGSNVDDDEVTKNNIAT